MYVGVPLLAITIVLSSVVMAKLLRRRRRRTRAAGLRPVRRAAGASSSTTPATSGNRCRSAAGVTRREQSREVVSPGARTLAVAADSHVFGPRLPRPRDAEAYWHDVDAEREAMSAAASRFQRFRAALNLTTFRAQA